MVHLTIDQFENPVAKAIFLKFLFLTTQNLTYCILFLNVFLRIFVLTLSRSFTPIDVRNGHTTKPLRTRKTKNKQQHNYKRGGSLFTPALLENALMAKAILLIDRLSDKKLM